MIAPTPTADNDNGLAAMERSVRQATGLFPFFFYNILAHMLTWPSQMWAFPNITRPVRMQEANLIDHETQKTNCSLRNYCKISVKWDIINPQHLHAYLEPSFNVHASSKILLQPNYHLSPLHVLHIKPNSTNHSS